MKKILFLFLLIFPVVVSFPQDMIYKKNGTTIPARITRIAPNEIFYDKPDSITKESSSVSILTVYMIRFANGVEEIFGTGKHHRPETFFIDHKDTYYYSIATGVGISYGFLGVRFQGRIGGKQGLGYHAGIGVFPIDADYQPARICYSAGLKFYFYKAWYAGLQIGRTVFPNSADYPVNKKDTINPVRINKRNGGPAMAISFLMGGDWFLNKNFGFNGAFGFAGNISEPLLDKMMATFDFGCVYKFGQNRKK